MQGVKAHSPPLHSRSVAEFEADVCMHELMDGHTDKQCYHHYQHISKRQIGKHSSYSIAVIDSSLLFRYNKQLNLR